MRETSRTSTLFALLAVACALSTLFVYRQPRMTPLEERGFGPEVRLPDAIFRVRITLRSGESVWGNAFLVDAKYRLYLTAGHVLENCDTGVLEAPQGEIAITNAWVEVDADIAVIEAAAIPEGVEPMPLATQPVRKGQTVYALAFQQVGRISPDRPQRVYSFRRRFTVVEAETDHCIDIRTCGNRDYIRWLAREGFPLTNVEMAMLYPYAIYATHKRGDSSVVGLIPGMSGGPLVDEQGVVVGVNARIMGWDLLGNHSMFAPANRAHDLLARVRAAIDARKKTN